MKLNALIPSLIYCLISCNSGPTTTEKSASMVDSLSSSIQLQEYDHFEVVRMLKQPKSMDCWATALTMLYSWKYGDNRIAILDVVKKYGTKYIILFQTNAGINAIDEKELYGIVGLTVRQRENPTIKLWYELLKKHGPLSITVDATPPLGTIHALIVNGIKGDGSSNGTKIDYVDPGDGLQHNLVFSEFLKLYEGSAVWPLQIIYWP